MTAHPISSAEKIQLDFVPLPIASTPLTGVDLWLLDLSELADRPHPKFASLVSPDELARASQFKNNSTRFLTTRAFLRLALARYAGVHAQELLFARGEHGKPFLCNAPTPIHFNLTHCDSLAVLAISARCKIGVDIETASKRDYLKIAKRYFHANELRALHDCPVTEREILFYKLWTLKEAFFKATGNGISSGLDKIFFQFENEEIIASFNSTLNEKENDWQFHQAFIAANTLVALALNSAQPVEHQWLNGNSLLQI